MTLLQLMLPVFVWAAIGEASGWWICTLVFYFLYLAIGNNVGMHRYYCHQYFEMHPIVEGFVAWCSAMACVGSPVSYAGIHVIHHKYADTHLDAHGPHRGLKSIMYWFHRHIQPNDVTFTRNIGMLNVRYGWLHNHYWLWVFGCASLMYMIGGWNVLLFCWLLPASLTLWAVSLVLILQHDKHGPSNTKSYMWFGWGETFHGNHHKYPTLKNHSMNSRCPDFTYLICKVLARKGSIE